MITEPQLTKVSIVSFFFFIIYVLYQPNLEVNGFGLLFFWFILSNAYLFYDFKNLPHLLVATLLFISLFLMVISIIHLQQSYAVRSEPIQHFPEIRQAIDKYKLMFLISESFLLFLILFTKDKIGTYNFIPLIEALKIQGPFSNIDKIKLSIQVIFYTTILGMSSYLVYLSYWIYKHSQYIIE
jgi:hypothetical protein